VRNNKAIRGLLNMDEIKLDDDGNLTGLDDQIKSLHKSDAYLFDDGAKQNYNPENGNPPASDATQAMVDVFKGV
ncbi:MAG: phage scaffolding protein, partial [Limosilactobacillus fermentum]|nr:phage scaffolding protein [Limosilactobacillus fermentum]